MSHKNLGKYTMLALLFKVSLMLAACGKTESSGSASKELFSSWQQSSGEVLDLTGFVFDFTNIIDIAVYPNAGCICNLVIVGSQSSGTATLSSCTHYGPANYCSPGTTIFNYSNISATLTLCEQGQPTCEVYQ